ncbi:MAG TPA: EAL domain-containing protein [Xanthobacteraceae bacterium]|nr:EAL domain-containing protein [Xanthobacteraceae bacterium]
MGQTKNKLIAAVLGTLVAAAPVYWFTDWLQRQGEAEASVSAKSSIAQLNLTVRETVEKLDDLASRGIDACTPANVDALRQALFTTGAVKELALVAPSGQTMCTDTGTTFAARDVIASAATSDPDVMLDVVRLVGSDVRLLRVRLVLPQRRPALAALLPAVVLVPQVAPNGNRLEGYARLTLADGTVIGVSGDERESPPGDDHVSAEARSSRFGPVMMVTLRRHGTIASYGDLQRIAIVVSAIFALTILLAALFIPWRARHNPIAEIEAALIADEFIPYYQPIIDIKSGRLLGAEVLVRWRKPDGTIIAPGAFIPLVESSGLILDLTRSLMRQVCADVGAAIGARPQMYITFNIAPRHFHDAIVLNDVGAIFEGSPIRLSQIVLEITERFEIQNLTATRRVIAALQGLGCRVALDDVGTGHNGLSYILKLGVDIIKIDKLFVEAIKTERQAQAIVETLVGLARDLRMQIVAEGVERIDQVEYLRDHGISAAQGYVFAPPLPGAAFTTLIEAIDPLATDAEKAAPEGAKGVNAMLGRLAAA